MIRNITLAISLLLLTSGLMAQQGFRNSPWGSTRASVKGTETCSLVDESSSKLVYACELSDIKGRVFYVFSTSDKLIRAKYFLVPEHLNMNFFIQDYNMFKDLLTEKYGESTSFNVTSVNKQSMDESEWAAGLLTGGVRIESKWESESIQIFLTLSRVGEKPAIQIDYVSKQHTDNAVLDKKELLRKYL